MGLQEQGSRPRQVSAGYAAAAQLGVCRAKMGRENRRPWGHQIRLEVSHVGRPTATARLDDVGDSGHNPGIWIELDGGAEVFVFVQPGQQPLAKALRHHRGGDDDAGLAGATVLTAAAHLDRLVTIIVDQGQRRPGLLGVVGFVGKVAFSSRDERDCAGERPSSKRLAGQVAAFWSNVRNVHVGEGTDRFFYLGAKEGPRE